MTGRKVQLAYIVNNVSRKAAYKKRQKGLIKKASELSTLCNIKVCAIVYGPYDPKPEIWPNPKGFQRVLAHFKSLSHEERTKKMVSQETFLKQKNKKSADQLKKLQREASEKRMTQLMSQYFAGNIDLQSLSFADLTELSRVVNKKLKEIQKRQTEAH